MSGQPRSSLDTWEHLHTSDQRDLEWYAKASNTPEHTENANLSKWVSRRQPEGPTEGDQEVATEALRMAVSRDQERRAEVAQLVIEDEPAHARRLATCGRRSVQLRCSECGSTDNYVPVTCDSRLCESCMRDRMGEVIGQYKSVVGQWERPTLLTLTIPNVESVEAGVDRVRDAFSRFRRRVVPVGGESKTGNKRWAWTIGGDDPVTDPWRTKLLRGVGRAEVARLESQYIREGRGIPMDELVAGGLYGIDIKQQAPGRFHVHIHAFVNMSYCPQPALAEVWRDVTGADGEAGEIVDVRRVDDTENGLSEVTGYVCKPPEFESVAAEVEAMVALKNRRLVQPFGDLHGRSVGSTAFILCCDCERIPEMWMYEGTVDKIASTVKLQVEADRPPPDVS